nr:MAG TPA: hypothetical protein [Bacteriophage sp.]
MLLETPLTCFTRFSITGNLGNILQAQCEKFLI